ncbi:dnaJ homolog subfamily B member 14-like [Episyrphus balteatus]|uniref:dnaJ homolog subfamily B member 14-like n=1 Tax=Episyrphus balteatus TaxID=286459 RepID=UPI002485BEAD|nr:dnaJ homolog subfamily B member 14-like [Episyrphus balteatus]
MDENKVVADRFIEIAITALIERNFEKAVEFLHKAEKLFPSLLFTITQILTNSNKNSTTDNDSQPTQYSNEQLEAVNKIQKCQNYYQVLDVPKESNELEIRKAYKKLALQLHPDKNNAPGATEAFKVLGNATDVLTDFEKRKTYDLHGINKPLNQKIYKNDFQCLTNEEWLMCIICLLLLSHI